jgi:Uma2 family endonuclease
MNIALRRTMTVAEYLAWGDAQGGRVRAELINGQIVAMSPERADHNRTKGRIFLALSRAVSAAALGCEAFTDGMTVPIDEHTAYEPDALVHCGAPIPAQQLTVPAPIIVAEVLSPTTSHSDTSAKLIGYFKLPSVHHYLVIDPQGGTLTHYARGQDGAVAPRTLTSGTLRLDPPGLELQVSDVLG